MAVSISDRKWVTEGDGTRKEKIEFMLDSQDDIASPPDPERISASSIALVKPTKQIVFITNGTWAG